MKTLIRILLFAVLCLPLFGLPLLAQNTQRMDEIANYYYNQKQFMGSVLVARGDQAVFSKSYGYANLEWQNAFTPDTKFRLGSLTKQFTAACIMLLQEDGKLKTSDPVSQYVSNAPVAWQKITIRNLLTHTSGIPNFTSFSDYPTTQALPTTPQKTIARFLSKPLDFQPGEKFDYSNSNYIVLGYIIEKTSGESYIEFLTQRILKPLGLSNTGYDTPQILPHRAAGYTLHNKQIENTGLIDMTVPYAAGSLYSTTTDLMRWNLGIYGGHLLKPASLTEMTTSFKSDYAYGIVVKNQAGHKVIEHGGGINGFNTSLIYFPEDRVSVVALSNLNGPGVDEIANKAADIFYGKPVVLPSERKEVQVPQTTLQGYVGEYQTGEPPHVMSVFLKEGVLMTQIQGQPAFQLHPESDTKFFLKEVDAQVEFVRDASSKAKELVLTQGGETIHWLSK